MVRKSKRPRQPGPLKVFLKRNDRIKAVACLDYSLEHKLDLAIVMAANFESLRGCEDGVVREATREALRKEWSSYGREDGGIPFKPLLSEGSSSMRYPEKDNKILREARVNIQEPARQRRRSTSQVSPISPRPRTVLSNKPDGSDKTLQFDDLGHPKKTAARGSSTTPHTRRPLRGRSTVSRTAAPSADIKEEPLPAESTLGTEMPEIAAPLNPNSDGRENRLSSLEKELADTNKQLKLALQNIVEQKDHIFALSNRLSAAERECRKIEHSIKKATDLKDDITMQANLRYEYSVLRDQNIKMINQREAFSLAATDSLRPKNQTIREEFELMLSDLKDASSSVNITLPAAADVEWGSCMEAWSHRLTGSGFGQLITHCLGHDISEIHLITAVAAAGATELVFESSFPDFLTRASPMLDQYREQILSKGR